MYLKHVHSEGPLKGIQVAGKACHQGDQILGSYFSLTLEQS